MNFLYRYALILALLTMVSTIISITLIPAIYIGISLLQILFINFILKYTHYHLILNYDFKTIVSFILCNLILNIIFNIITTTRTYNKLYNYDKYKSTFWNNK